MFAFVFLFAVACTYIEISHQVLVENIGSAMILSLQSHSSYLLDLSFEVLGEITGAMFLSISGALYLCGYTEIGVLGSYAGFLGAAFSGTAKMLIMHPRPFLKVPQIHNFTCPSDWGSPSGHASSAGAAMIVLAFHWMKNKKNIYLKALFFLVCGLIIVVDRVYLGVHYPFQVVLGYAYALCVGVYFIQDGVLESFFKIKSSNLLRNEHIKIGVYCLVNTFIYNYSTFDLPQEWKNNYREKCGKDFSLDSAMAKNYNESLYTLIVAGILLGFYFTESSYSNRQKLELPALSRFTIGNLIAVVIVVYCLGVDKICLNTLPFGLRFLALAVNRYFSGFLIGFIGPKIFKKIVKEKNLKSE